MDSGIGFTNFLKFLTTMNIPPICFKTYKRYENEVGHAMEQLAKRSCEEAAAIERKLTMENALKLQENL